jgi:hypothetical protein
MECPIIWKWEYRNYKVGSVAPLAMPPIEVLNFYFELDHRGILWRKRTPSHQLLKVKKLAGKLNAGNSYETETIRDSYGKKGSISLHRLVFWMNHQRDIRYGMVVNHIDHDKLNNHPSNLAECSLSENRTHG